MRVIPIAKLKLSAAWKSKAKRAQADLEKAFNRIQKASNAQQRQARVEAFKKLISKKAPVWSSLKKELQKLSYGKCWYCESREKRSDMAVDHFRPKNAVFECKAHLGYWWLACDPKNYRLACSFCNSQHKTPGRKKSLGKGTHFPLLNEKRRVYESSGDISKEANALLDPVVGFDTTLVSFSEDGLAAPVYTKKSAPKHHKRAAATIEILNLNDVNTRDARIPIVIAVQQQVALGDKYLTLALKGDQSASDHVDQVHRNLLSLTSVEAEFSTTARAILAGYRDKDWIDHVFRAM